MTSTPEVFRAQGRVLSRAELVTLQTQIAEHPDWSRQRIARELCLPWNWRTARGQLKTFAARELLGKRERRHHLRLGPRGRKLSAQIRSTHTTSSHQARQRLPLARARKLMAGKPLSCGEDRAVVWAPSRPDPAAAGTARRAIAGRLNYVRLKRGARWVDW